MRTLSKPLRPAPPRLLWAAPLTWLMLATTPAVAGGASLWDRDDALGPLDLAKVQLKQSGRNSRLLVATRGRWRFRQLDAKPGPAADPAAAQLCLELGQDGRRTRSCLGASPRGKPILVQARISEKGRAIAHRRVEVGQIGRPDRRSVAISLRFRRLGLTRGGFRWRVVSDWDGPRCRPEPANGEPEDVEQHRARPSLCRDQAPNVGTAHARIRRPRVVGCTRARNRITYSGSHRRKRVALTFDDGPSGYTSRVMRILEDHGARGTFYVLGGKVGARAALVRRMVARGHEIGNHSLAHRGYPSYADLAATSRRIKSASGFRPCTFRPPYGAVSNPLVDSAWRLGMSTVLWDIDTNDWQKPGSGAIVSRALAAGPGSIVLMHDGGGYRGQTVAALPRIVKTFRRRGYKLVTVTKLLGERRRWKP